VLFDEITNETSDALSARCNSLEPTLFLFAIQKWALALLQKQLQQLIFARQMVQNLFYRTHGWFLQ